jgi:acyl carrier protein
MELAWLVHQIEQHYDLHLDDDTMARMTTVSGVVDVLGGFGGLRPDRA